MVVKLQGEADDLEAPLDQQGRGYRRIDAARHGDHYPVVGRVSGEIEV
jgi:hypothetical protein